MVFENTDSLAVIIMLTPTVEAGREKCAQYFPLNEEQSIITLDDPDISPDHPPPTVRLLEFEYNEKACSGIRKLELAFEGETKTVWHIQFYDWPDFGSPERDRFLELIALSTQKNESPDSPYIVHDSAGVGRTGTFIALKHLLDDLKDPAFVATIPDGTDLVFDTVNELREQRMMMVQSEVQYQFIYSLLREWFESPTWPTWVGTRHAQEPLIEPSAITSSSIDTGAGEHQAQPGKKRKSRHG